MQAVFRVFMSNLFVPSPKNAEKKACGGIQLTLEIAGGFVEWYYSVKAHGR
jgi:hypothetical protein